MDLAPLTARCKSWAYGQETVYSLHAVCMHIFLRNGAIFCKIMQNCMVTDRMETSG